MNAAQYQRQLDAVSDYIYSHLDEDLDLGRLADVACMSPYHWHRVYRGLRGETAAETVRRLRLHRAAGYLAETDLPVRRIADRAGFTNLQSFTRIFKSYYGVPPATYRATGIHSEFRAPGAAALPDHPVSIQHFPPLTLLSSPHKGSFLDIGRAFGRVQNAIAGPTAAGQLRMIAIYYDDPELTVERELRSRAGVAVDRDDPTPDGLQRVTIPGGPHAVLRYRGPYASMHAAYQWLYGTWLPNSGATPGEHPVFEDYLNDPVVTAPHDLLTDICLPLS